MILEHFRKQVPANLRKRRLDKHSHACQYTQFNF
jgi:hypothetical protein